MSKKLRLWFCPSLNLLFFSYSFRMAIAVFVKRKQTCIICHLYNVVPFAERVGDAFPSFLYS